MVCRCHMLSIVLPKFTCASEMDFIHTQSEVSADCIGILSEPEVSDIVIQVVDYMVSESPMLSNASYEIVKLDSTNIIDGMDYVRAALALLSFYLRRHGNDPVIAIVTWQAISIVDVQWFTAST
ncbi:hypothetical protein CAPTEDRAFT_193300 [Capitella teleta]|uniref:Uncharacterized protein n=1 Tax=Capitella teleta TaxID=283909 RepID=R7UV43_CAPTE|nr:hypothetical protein CAPTEDRAFT_193300 [Capitella teleta]|eukprot:ELU10008.1 hypothetical protein CAPTEDRAFT_193300 [Capitella teleta]